MVEIVSWLSSLQWAAPTWDLFILLFFLFGSLLYGLSLGREKIIVILVGLYMALAIVTNVPSLHRLTLAFRLNDQYVLKVTLFLGIFIILFFLLSHSALLKTLAGSEGSGSWWQTMIFSILQVGLLISITLNFLPIETTKYLSDTTRTIFMSEQGRSAWLIVPLLMMVIIPSKKNEDIPV